MKVEIVGQQDRKPMSSMALGEIAQITEGVFGGRVVIRTGGSIVTLLDSPQTFWTNPIPSTMYVRTLPKGTQLKLEV